VWRWAEEEEEEDDDGRGGETARTANFQRKLAAVCGVSRAWEESAPPPPLPLWPLPRTGVRAP